MSEDVRAAWLEALDDLERRVGEAERLVRREDAPAEQDASVQAWSAPELPGPLPQELLPRAQQLLARQQRAMAAAAAAMRSTRDEARLVRRMTDTGHQNRSAYVDTTA